MQELTLSPMNTVNGLIKRIFRPLYRSCASRMSSLVRSELQDVIPPTVEDSTRNIKAEIQAAAHNVAAASTKEITAIHDTITASVNEIVTEMQMAFDALNENKKVVEELHGCFQGAKKWKLYTQDHFMRALFENTKAFTEFYDMLADDASRATFDWLVGYRFLTPIFGEPNLWESFEPSAIYKMLPGSTSVEQFRLEVEETKRILPNLPSDESQLYCLWHTFVNEHYTLQGKCEAEADDIVFDIGGYIGDTAVYFSQKVGSEGHVYIFEANDWMIARIKENVQKCSVTNFTLVENGVWDKKTPLYFKCNSTYESFVEDATQINAITLDDFVDENNITKLDFIKMDIEGAEKNALLGARKCIKKLRPKMAISIYHQGTTGGYADFYTLPAFIKKLCPNYLFYLSHKNASLWETVLFCTPKERS